MRQHPSTLEDVRTSLGHLQTMQAQCSQCILCALRRLQAMLSSIGSLFIYIPVRDTHNPRVHLPAVDNWSLTPTPQWKKSVSIFSNYASGVSLAALVTSFQTEQPQWNLSPGFFVDQVARDASPPHFIHLINFWKSRNTSHRSPVCAPRINSWVMLLNF